MKIIGVRTTQIEGHGYSTCVRIFTDEGVIGSAAIHGVEAFPEIIHNA